MIHSNEINSSKSLQANEYLRGWQRARAELDNFRKQVADQHLAAGTRQLINVISDFLPLADNFRAITAHVPAELKDNPWVQGVLHVSRQFNDTLQSLGVSEINETNVPFDPNLHEAISPPDNQDGANHQVAAVTRPGYRIGDTIIRPAQVQVK